VRTGAADLRGWLDTPGRPARHDRLELVTHFIFMVSPSFAGMPLDGWAHTETLRAPHSLGVHEVRPHSNTVRLNEYAEYHSAALPAATVPALLGELCSWSNDGELSLTTVSFCVCHRLFEAFPPLKYLLYTPSYHSLHHSRVHTNFCLFMPLYDYVYGTASPESDSLHASAWQGGRVASDKKPDVVSPCCTPSFNSNRNLTPCVLS